MACTNDATLIRFVVRMTVSCGTPVGPIAPLVGGVEKSFSSITKVSGIDLGEEGTISVPFWGRMAQMSDGIRVFKPLAIQLRIPRLPFEPGSDFAAISAMYNQRAALRYNIDVWVTDRSFEALMLVRFFENDMKKFSFEDMELGAAKVGVVDTEFLPRDVKLYDCKGTGIIIDSPGAAAEVLTLCP